MVHLDRFVAERFALIIDHLGVYVVDGTSIGDVLNAYLDKRGEYWPIG